MTTPKTPGNRPTTPKTRTSRPATKATRTSRTPRSGTQPVAKDKRAPRSSDTQPVAASPETKPGGRTITLTVPTLGEAATRAINVATTPVATARRLLPVKGGLPLYTGLGVLTVASVIEWPVALGIGVGYAVLRAHGHLVQRPARER
ncbi:hypothetical protein AB0L85_17285 [Streptomyces sp. NPDC052051]|uniref:hypothetical protein n=1 Tax=Streptomyces sp. NPDC052051 TaxID=3154649 RepID=UPI0034458EF1